MRLNLNEDDSDLNEVNTKLPGGDTNKNEADTDLPSSDIDVDAIPDEDDSDNDRYVGRLGGDHQYIDSSECDSDDITDMLDAEAVRGVDLPGRRKSKKGRHDDEGIVAIFELGMFFENTKEFRKALAKYVVEKNYQIKLRPNEAHRVRAKCKFKEKCKWLFYGAIDRDCGKFMIKNYHPIHKCSPSNKNKMCTTKFLVVVDKETKHSWSFFINFLKEDLQLGTRQGLTLEGVLDTYGLIGIKDGREWKEGNNFGDVPRHKSLITILVEIKRKIMTRTVDMVKFVDTWIFDIAPMDRLILEENKDKSRACNMVWNADVSHSSQFAGQSSQGSSHPEPRSSYQHGPIRFNQHASTTSSNHASSTIVYGDTIRVKRARETAKSSQPPPFVDTSITVIKGITSQLPPRTRQTAGQKRERVATGEDFARGGPKRPTNGGSSNVGFGIYTSASGI
ncbi:hypothetical protein KY289_016874 [Solanum tuberosum]|nr:hypothetical protein KY284_016671 [Solanum tuberosum]KAH0689516.1 hypothetical protein KY289_016874 [Solanum tuberosum]